MSRAFVVLHKDEPALRNKGPMEIWAEATPEMKAEFVAWIETGQAADNERYEQRKQSPTEYASWRRDRNAIALCKRLETEFGFGDVAADHIASAISWCRERFLLDGKSL